MEQSGDDIFEVVCSVTYEPPFHTPQLAELSKLEHYQLALPDINHFFELLYALMYLGMPHGQIFAPHYCSRYDKSCWSRR